MAPAEIERIGTMLFGARFRSALASALGVSNGAVTHWLDGKPVPGPVIAALEAWAEAYEERGRLPPISPGSKTRFAKPGADAPRSGRPPKSKYARLIG